MRILLIFLMTFTVSLQGETLKQSIEKVLQTNPQVLERESNYKAEREDISVAQSGYYPSLDLSLGLGYSDDKHTIDPVPEKNYDGSVYAGYITLSQNLFEGFATSSLISEMKAKSLAAAYKYVESVNSVSLSTVNAYLEVMRNKELLGTAQENVEINILIFEKVRRKYDSGLTTLSEVKKIESAFALAESRVVIQEISLYNAEYSLERVLGYPLPSENLVRPVLSEAKIPVSAEVVRKVAMENNPSLLVSMYNIRQAQSRHENSKSNYYPQLDLELTESYDENTMYPGTRQEKQGFRGMVYLSYNLFRGFADSSIVQKNVSRLQQALQTKEDLKREVDKSINLSWVSYTKLQEQLSDLERYKGYSEETLKLFVKEYNLGRRSLLDLLSAQRDFIGAKEQIITTEYSILLAKYQILDAMGMMVSTILEDDKVVFANVGIGAEVPENDLLSPSEK